MVRGIAAINRATTIDGIIEARVGSEYEMAEIAERLGASGKEDPEDPDAPYVPNPEDPSEIDIESARSEAKDALEDYAYDRKNDIKGRTDLYDSEKEALYKLIDEELESAYAAIDNADTLKDIAKAQAYAELNMDEIAGAPGVSGGVEIPEDKRDDSDDPVVPGDDDSGVQLQMKKREYKEKLAADAEKLKAVVEKRQNLTNAEKEEIYRLLKEELVRGCAAIDMATTMEELQEAFDLSEAKMLEISELLGKSGEEKVPNPDDPDDPLNPGYDKEESDITFEAAKNAAKKELEDYAFDSKNAIDARDDLYGIEKAMLKSLIDQELTRAYANIDTAVTQDEIDIAVATSKANMDELVATPGQSKGETVDPDVNPDAPDYDPDKDSEIDLAEKKNEAKKAVKDYADSLKAKYESDSRLTDAQKALLKSLINEELVRAYDAIDRATSSNEITAARDESIAIMDRIAVAADDAIESGSEDKLDLEKEISDAKKELKKFAFEQKEYVNGRKDLYNSEKQKLCDLIDAEMLRAYDLIDNAKTVAEIEKIVATAEANMYRIARSEGHNGDEEVEDPTQKPEIDPENPTEVELEEKKNEAKEQLEEYAEKAKAAIDARDDLYDEEKGRLKALIDDVLTRGKATIDGANSFDEITVAVIKAEGAMDKLVATPGQSGGDSVDPDVNPDAPGYDPDADSDIDLAEAKKEAKDDIEGYAEERKSDIESNNKLTDIEKEILKGIIDNERDRTYEAIDNAKDQAGIDAALQAGKDKMDKIAALKGQSGDEEADPEAPYDPNPETPSELDVEKERDAAKKEVEIYAEAKKAEIDERKGLTKEEKQALKNIIDHERDRAYEALEGAASKEDMDNIVKNAKANMDRIARANGDDGKEPDGEDDFTDVELEQKKDAAKEELAEYAEIKKAEIDKAEGLSDEERQALKDIIDNERDRAYESIDKAKTPSDVEGIVTEVKAVMDRIARDASVELEQSKDAAKKELVNEANRLEEEIRNKPLSEAEKQAIIDRIEKELTKAIQAVNNAETVADVEIAKQDGLKAMRDVERQYAKEQAVREQAKKELEEKANRLEKEILLRDDLSKADKLEIIERIKAELAKAKAAVDNANISDVEEVKQAGIRALEEAELNYAKAKAKQEVERRGEDAKKELEGLIEQLEQELNDPETSDERRNEVQREIWQLEDKMEYIDQKMAEAFGDIEDATTTEEVKSIVDRFAAEIGGLVDSANADLKAEKEAAKKELQNKANEKKQKIEEKVASGELTRAEANEILARLGEVLQEAKEEVDKAVNSEQVEAAKQAGLKKLEEVELDVAKDKGKEELENKAQDAKDAIDSNPNLSDEEKQAAKDAIDDALIEAKDKVDDATTPEEVQNAVDEGIGKIVGIVDEKDEGLKNSKNEALEDLDEKYEEAKGEIEKNPNLSAEEKEEKRKELEKEYEEAKKKIEQATTPEEAKNAAAAGANSMGGVVDSLPKDEPTDDGLKLDLGIASVSLGAQAIAILAAFIIIRRKTRV